MSNWWTKRVYQPILKLLKQGTEPKQLALALCLGFFLALLPLFGIQSLLCALVIFLFRLNPTAVFLINNLAYPLFFFCYIPFLKAGAWLLGQSTEVISATLIYEQLQTNTLEAIKTYFKINMAAIGIWLLVSLPFFLISWLLLERVLRGVRERLG